MGYVGTIPLSGDYRKLDDISSGFNGSETAFTLQVGSANVTPPKETTVTISVGGILQEPVTAYTISGSTITFTAAPSAGADFFGVLLGDAMSIGTPANDTVTGAKIVDDAINSEHYAAGSIDNEHIADGTIALAKTALVAGTGITLATNTLNIDAAQTQITSVGTLTVLAIDNITINGNTISSTAGTDLNITPLAGQQIVLDGTIVVDAGVVTGATSITSNSFVGALTGNSDTVTTNANLTGMVTSSGNAASLGAFTKAQLSTAVSDGTPLYSGDAPTVGFSLAVAMLL